jgi:hypothetical protein
MRSFVIGAAVLVSLTAPALAEEFYPVIDSTPLTHSPTRGEFSGLTSMTTPSVCIDGNGEGDLIWKTERFERL